MNLRQRLLNLNFENIIFNLACVAMFIKILKLSMETLGRFDLQSFQTLYIWKCFIISLLSYCLVLFLSFLYFKLFKVLSVPILYIGFLFLFYFLTLINLLTFKIADHSFFISCLVVLSIPIIYKVIKDKHNIMPVSSGGRAFLMVDMLILIWLVHSLCFFLEYNFNRFRMPYGDETGFWFIVSKNMILEGNLKAQLINYPGGRHPFGIPFISAFPSGLFGVPFIETIFFMPIIIITALLMFLNAIKSNKWIFLFFYLALFGAFNNRCWIGQLCYRVVYGEGISMVFFLLITYEIKKLVENNNIKIKDLLGLSFCIGLLSLSKSPASYFSIIFSVIFISLFYINNRGKINRLRFSLLAFVISLLPFLAWKVFCLASRINSVPFYENLLALQSNLSSNGSVLFSINLNMLRKVVLALVTNCPDAIYYTILSFIFILTTFRKKEFIYLVPVACLIFFVFFYYGYVYEGDYGSSMRYLMPQALALYYLGAIGFNKVFNIIDRHKRPRIIKLSFIIVSIILLTMRIF